MSKQYKDLIFTDHALHRISLRSLHQEAIYQAVHQPEKSIDQEEGKVKFIKQVNDRRYHIVAKRTEQDQWLVISVWVRGEEDPVPLVWRLITFPFQAGWWLVKKLYLSLQKDNK